MGQTFIVQGALPETCTATDAICWLNANPGLAAWAQLAGALLIGGLTIWMAISANGRAAEAEWELERRTIAAARTSLIDAMRITSPFVHGRPSMDTFVAAQIAADQLKQIATRLEGYSLAMGPRRANAAVMISFFQHALRPIADAAHRYVANSADLIAWRDLAAQAANLSTRHTEIDPMLVRMEQAPRTRWARLRKRRAEKRAARKQKLPPHAASSD